MKAHIGVDAATGLVHSLATTAANVADITQVPRLLHGAETRVWGDGLCGRGPAPRAPRRVDWQVALRPGQRRRLAPGSAAAQAEQRKASIRAKVEHPFLYVKRHFGYAQVRYRALAKNRTRLLLRVRQSAAGGARRARLSGRLVPRGGARGLPGGWAAAPQNAATPPPSGAWQRPSRSGAPVVQSFPRNARRRGLCEVGVRTRPAFLQRMEALMPWARLASGLTPRRPLSAPEALRDSLRPTTCGRKRFVGDGRGPMRPSSTWLVPGWTRPSSRVDPRPGPGDAVKKGNQWYAHIDEVVRAAWRKCRGSCMGPRRALGRRRLWGVARWRPDSGAPPPRRSNARPRFGEGGASISLCEAPLRLRPGRSPICLSGGRLVPRAGAQRSPDSSRSGAPVVQHADVGSNRAVAPDRLRQADLTTPVG